MRSCSNNSDHPQIRSAGIHRLCCSIQARLIGSLDYVDAGRERYWQSVDRLKIILGIGSIQGASCAGD